MTTVVNIQSRRESRIPDKAQLVSNFADGLDSLVAEVAGWPFKVVRAQHVLAAERSLHALQQLILALYAHIPPDDTRGVA